MMDSSRINSIVEYKKYEKDKIKGREDSHAQINLTLQLLKKRPAFPS